MHETWKFTAKQINPTHQNIDENVVDIISGFVSEPFLHKEVNLVMLHANHKTLSHQDSL